MLLLTVVAFGCGGARPADGTAGADGSDVSGRAAAAVPARDAYVRDPFAIDERTTAGVRAAFGSPDSATVRPVANRHIPGQTDTLVALHYPGAMFEFYRVTRGREFLRHAVVASNRFLRHPRPGIGTPVDSLLAWFGLPDERVAGKLVYLCERCLGAPEPVLFWIEAGRVRRIEFVGYVD